MTTLNRDELDYSLSGFPPHTAHLLSNPTTRPIFLSIIIILKIYPVLVLILGLFGNLLSFCVLLRANMRRYSTFCYLACLALVDIGVIMTFCINFISLYHFNNDIQNGSFACKLFSFCIYFLPQYSSWILVAVSIDRVISAKYLRLAKTWTKPRHSVLVTLLLGLVLGILNSHFFLYENNSLKKQQQQQQRTIQSNRSAFDTLLSVDSFPLQHTDDFALINSFSNGGGVSSSSIPYGYTPPPSASQFVQRDTTLQQEYESYITIQQETTPPLDVNIIYCSLENSPEHASLHKYWTMIDLLMNVFLPFTAMIACTIIIIITLVRSSERSGSTSARRSRRRRNISVMLITVNGVFISLTAPIVVFLSMYELIKDDTSYYRQTVLTLIKVFCIILMNLNHSVNIIVYSVTAKEFRTEMMSFLKVILYCIIGKPVAPNDFSYMYDDGTIFARLRRFRNNLFRCCRIKMRSNSTNTTDSGGLQHTTVPGMNNRTSRIDLPVNNRTPQNNRNGRRKSSNIRFSETSTIQRNSHRLTVQLQPDAVSSVCDREDVSLHGLSNSTED